MAASRDFDQDIMQKLLLGELPSADVERLAAKYADDERLSKVAESLTGQHETLVDLLHNHETQVDVDGELLVARLLVRLKPDLSGKLEDSPAAGFQNEAGIERNSVGLPINLPGWLEFYRPLKVLGQGGMGTVYLAEDTRLGRNVAIKTLRPELAVNAQAKERFLREARSAAMLEHDNIVPIYSVGEADGTPFLAMPVLRGESLSTLIQRTNGPLPVSTAVRLAREVALGLAAAHERGLIHRDIKPANIWLEAPSGRVKILDFGLAKAAEVANSSDVQSALTATGAIVGTPAYMAPEQANGDLVDGRADLFSLGCVLYEMLSGQRAFSGSTTFSILMSLANQTPIAPDIYSPQCPPALSRLVMQLLEKDPAKRPPSAAAVVQALDHLDGLSCVAPTEVLPAPLPRPTAQAVGWAARASLIAQTRPQSLRSEIAAIVATCLLACMGVAIVFGGQIVRVITNTGELLIDIDDRTVEVRIIQNGLIVKEKTTNREFELTAVDGQVEVLEKNGIKLTTKRFQLTRGGTATITVTVPEIVAAREASRTTQLAANDLKQELIASVLADKANPFVLIHPNGEGREEFGSLEGALGALNDGDMIEVHGNGPFTLGSILLRGKDLRLRAATGYRPQLVMSKHLSTYYWFEIDKGDVDIEGCDLRCGNGMVCQCFRGTGESWTFRNCRLLGSDVGMMSYEGSQLRFIDCLISGFAAPGYEGFGPGTGNCHLEMINSIVRNQGYQMLQVRSDPDAKGTWTVNLQHNTLYVKGGLILQMGRKKYAQTRVAASANLMNVLGVANNAVLKEIGGWQGRDNLYVGRQALMTVLEEVKDPVAGLKAWAEFWGADEERGHEAEWAHYAWDEVRRQGSDPQRAIQVLSPIAASLASQHGPAFQELGPDWALVGPGDAYVCALEAAGKLVALDQLRPAPLADGPFVLIHADKVVRGFAKIGDAVAAAVSGDVIEIRTDDPFGRCPLQGDQPRQLTIRAAPGYRPVAEDGFDFASKNLSLVIEGLHFSKFPLGAGLGGDSTEAAVQNSIARVANCSFTSQSDFVRFAGRLSRNGINGPRFESADGKPGEIVNCLIPGMVSMTLPANGKLLVKNSVVSQIQILAATSGARALELERCIVWNPCGDTTSIEFKATNPQKVKSEIVVSARHTLFESGARFIFSHEGTRVTRWTGAGNVYRVGHRVWLTEPAKPGAIGLADWKRLWNSDADSIEADPVDYAPQQWKLLPGSPGYRAGPDGQDLGADISRIATIGPGR